MRALAVATLLALGTWLTAVSIGDSGCCSIPNGTFGKPMPPRGADWDAIKPCCAVSAIDAASLAVTARWHVTGRVVRFRAPSAQALQEFHVGQAVDVADAGAGKLAVRTPTRERFFASRVE